MRIVHLFILVLLAFFIGCSKQSTEPKDEGVSLYYELKPGKYWDYALYSGSGSFIDSWREVVTGKYPGSENIYIYDTDGYKSYWGWKDDGLYIYGLEDTTFFDHPIKLYPRKAKVGDTYPYNFVPGAIVEVISVDQQITVPAGSFKCVVGVAKIGERIIETAYIAPEVGLVFKESFNQQTGALEERLQLIDYAKSENTNQQVLFKASFIKDWLAADAGEGNIFVSDVQGQLLADASFYGNSDVTLYLPQHMSSVPSRVSVTTVIHIPSLNLVLLTTNMDVVPGSWTWKGKPPIEAVGSVNLQFTNIPNHSGYMISSSSGSCNGNLNGQIVDTATNIYESPDNIFISLWETIDHPRYLWVNNVEPGNTYVVDLSKLQPMYIHTVQLNTSAEYYWFRVLGFPVVGEHYGKKFCISNWSENTSGINHISIPYPWGAFADYNTRIDIREAGTTSGYEILRYIKYGSLPGQFKKIDAEIQSITTQPASISLQSSGNFDEIFCSLYFNDGNIRYYWRIYAPNYKSNIQLPYLPTRVLQRFPNLNRESFELRYVELIDQIGLNGYDEIIDAYFKNSEYFYDIVSETLILFKTPTTNRAASNQFMINPELRLQHVE